MVPRRSPLDARDRKGYSALATAAVLGDVAVVEELLAAGASPGVATSVGDTPLMLALRHGWLAIARRLMLAGTHVSSLSALLLLPTTTTSTTTAVSPSLSPAATTAGASAWEPRTLESLASLPCRPYARNKVGETPLLLAARRGFADVVAVLVDAGCRRCLGSLSGETALHAAAAGGHVDAMRELLLLRSPGGGGVGGSGSEPLSTALSPESRIRASSGAVAGVSPMASAVAGGGGSGGSGSVAVRGVGMRRGIGFDGRGGYFAVGMGSPRRRMLWV